MPRTCIQSPSWNHRRLYLSHSRNVALRSYRATDAMSDPTKQHSGADVTQSSNRIYSTQVCSKCSRSLRYSQSQPHVNVRPITRCGVETPVVDLGFGTGPPTRPCFKRPARHSATLASCAGCKGGIRASAVYLPLFNFRLYNRRTEPRSRCSGVFRFFWTANTRRIRHATRRRVVRSVASPVFLS